MRSFIASLRLIRDLTPVHPVSNVREAVPISLFQASNRINEITGNAFRISLHPDWQIDRSFFLTSQSSNPGTQVGAQSKDFGTVSQTDLTRV